MPRAALCLLLAIPAISCGGRSDLVDVAAADSRACSMVLSEMSTNTLIADTAASADLVEGETPSIFVGCQGAAGGTHYELTGRYELGRDEMQLTSHANGFRRGPTYDCRVQAQVNGASTRSGDHYVGGDRFSMMFTCQLDTMLAVEVILTGTLSAPLTAD